MNIVVCVKYVPDAQADRRFTAADNTTDRSGVDGLLSELDEYAVEEALKITETADGKVTVLTVGPAEATTALRKALQMGAHEAVHVLDDAIHGSDAIATSRVLAAAIGKLEYDLVLTGMASTDGTMSVVPAMLAEWLGLPQVTFASELTIDGTTARIRRDGDTSTEIIEATLPAVISVTDQINDPRYPSFKGIMAAKSKPVDQVTVADLGIDASAVGWGGAGQEIVDVSAAPERQAGEVIEDDGEGFQKIVEFLDGLKVL
jgi:electron transfer flavoprotein beta subunit